jgi:hypothetical protein
MNELSISIIFGLISIIFYLIHLIISNLNKNKYIYNYRNLPKDCVPPRYLWVVKGIDTKIDKDKDTILEYCTSYTDACYVFSNMKQEIGRFIFLGISENPEKVKFSDPVELNELLKSIPEDFKGKEIELNLNYGAFMNIPISKAEFRLIYSDANNSRPALILQTDDYIPSQSKGIHY